MTWWAAVAVEAFPSDQMAPTQTRRKKDWKASCCTNHCRTCSLSMWQKPTADRDKLWLMLTAGNKPKSRKWHLRPFLRPVDQSHNKLWRIQHIEVCFYFPSYVVLHIYFGQSVLLHLFLSLFFPRSSLISMEQMFTNPSWDYSAVSHKSKGRDWVFWD